MSKKWPKHPKRRYRQDNRDLKLGTKAVHKKAQTLGAAKVAAESLKEHKESRAKEAARLAEGKQVKAAADKAEVKKA